MPLMSSLLNALAPEVDITRYCIKFICNDHIIVVVIVVVAVAVLGLVRVLAAGVVVV